MNQTYLQIMGIERWLLQQPKTDYYCYQLQGKNCIGILFADKNGSDEERQLVEKIVQATDCHYEAISADEVAACQVAILLGPNVTQKWANQADTTLSSHAPCAIQNNLTLKKEVWRELQKAMRILNA